MCDANETEKHKDEKSVKKCENGIDKRAEVQYTN